MLGQFDTVNNKLAMNGRDALILTQSTAVSESKEIKTYKKLSNYGLNIVHNRQKTGTKFIPDAQKGFPARSKRWDRVCAGNACRRCGRAAIRRRVRGRASTW